MAPPRTTKTSKATQKAAPQSAPIKAPERKQTVLTVDEEQTLRMLKALGILKRKKQTPLAASLIMDMSHDVVLQSKFAQFYRNSWPLIEPRNFKSRLLFTWPAGIAEALDQIAYDVLAVDNRSETLRVLVAFFASEAGILTVPRR